MPTYSDVFSGRTAYTLQLIVTEGSQSISNNTTSVSYTLRIVEASNWSGTYTFDSATYSINIGGTTFSGSFTYDFRNYKTLNIRSGTVTISHDPDGTRTLSSSASVGGGTVIGSASVSGSFNLTTIPRASSSTFVSAIDAGDAFTITTNRASTSFTHTLRYSFGSLTNQTIATGVGASFSWTPPLSLLNQIPSATSGTMTITTITFSGSTQIGSTSRNITLRAPSEIVPTIGSISDSEFVSAVSSIVGAYVRNLSRITFTINGEAGAYGSTITTRRITFAGNTINADSGTTAVITQSGPITATATVTDSRGRTASLTKSITVLDYAAPTVTSVLARRSTAGGTLDDDGTSIRIDLNASVSSLVNSTQRNTLRYRVLTRTRGTGSYVERTNVLLATGTTSFNSSFVISSTYAVATAYDVRVEVIDQFNTTTIQAVVPTAAVFMHWGDGLAIGKYYESGRGSIDAMGQIYQNNGQAVASLNSPAFTGTVTAPAVTVSGEAEAARIRIPTTTDASLSSTGHGFQIGPDSGVNLVADGNEVMARNNGNVSTLGLNLDGGNVTLGNSTSTINLAGRINGANYPFAMAAGSMGGVNVVAGGTNKSTVTFPAGRFTAAPRIALSMTSDYRDISVFAEATATSTGFIFCRGSTAPTQRNSVTGEWIAVQMTSGNGSG